MIALFLSALAALQPSAQATAERATAELSRRGIPASELQVERVLPAREGQVVRFRQMARGVPVWHGSLVARLDGGGRVLRLHDARKEVGPFDPRPRFTPRGPARLVVVPGARPRLAWEVRLPARSRSENPMGLLDAADGTLVARWNRVFHAGPDEALVYSSSRDAVLGVTTRAVLGGFPSDRDPAGHLVGAQFTVRNCCPNAGCDGHSPPPVERTSYEWDGATYTWEMAHCEERPLASNARTEGSYVYAPADPQDGDEFAEVNAYFHLDSVFRYVTAVDPLFQLDQGKGPMRVTVNYLNVAVEGCEYGEGMRCTSLGPFDNAYFMPGWEGTTDSIVLGQGTVVDFAYDADVVYHEFGHAVVNAGPAFDGLTLDAWGAWDAPAALHEAYADWLAAVKSADPLVGDYVGPGLAGYAGTERAGIRDLSSGAACPGALNGEPHQDSLPFSSALWDLRAALPDLSPTELSRAVLDALKGLPADATFDQAAEATVDEIARVAPEARAAAEETFRRRGATGCERARSLDPGASIPAMWLAGKWRDPRLTTFVPGPWQIQLQAPPGAREAVLQYHDAIGGAYVDLGMEVPTADPTLRVAAWSGAPVRFSYDPTDGATIERGRELPVRKTGGAHAVTIPLSGACEGEKVYVALLDYSELGDSASEISVRYTVDAARAEACRPSAPEPPREEVKPPPAVPPLPVVTAEPAAPPSARTDAGCGCAGGAAPSTWFLIVLLLAVSLRPRNRSGAARA